MSITTQDKTNARRSVASSVDYRRDMKRLGKAPSDDSATPACAYLLPTQILDIERMAGQGMNLDTIGARLNIAPDVWDALLRLSPEIADAYRAGAARLVDIASAAAVKGVQAGEPSLIKYILDRFGGPQFRPKQEPAIIVQAGPVIEIDGEAMAQRFARQRALIDGTAEDLEGE